MSFRHRPHHRFRGSSSSRLLRSCWGDGFGAGGAAVVAAVGPFGVVFVPLGLVFVGGG